MKAYISIPNSPGGYSEDSHVLVVDNATGEVLAVRISGNNGTDFKSDTERQEAVKKYYGNKPAFAR